MLSTERDALAQAVADAIPRYEPPTWAEYAMMADEDDDQRITCGDCEHCFELNQTTRNRVKVRMGYFGHYGNWRKSEKTEREVMRALNHALGCFGVCEVRGELVELDNAPCETHYEGPEA